MNVLYLDTSSNFLYAAITNNSKIIIESKEKLNKDLSSLAMKKISEMFEIGKININDINKIIVVNGPGSFTGIRVGLTIAKVLAWAKNIPIIPISSLEAMTISDNETSDYVVAAIDARRNYVYATIYDKKNEKFVMNEQYISLKTLEIAMSNLPGKVSYITNDDIETKYSKNEYNPQFLNIIKYSLNKEEINPHLIDANYLKKTEAEEKNDLRSQEEWSIINESINNNF